MNPAKPKRWNAPDQTDFERENDELNQSLWRTFAPLREDVLPVEDSEVGEAQAGSQGDDFETEVQSKLAAAEKRMQQTSNFAKQAAAFLPPFLLPKALAPIAAATGPKTSSAFLPGLAALPALAVATLIFSAIAFLRYVFSERRQQPQESDQENSSQEIINWWRANIWKTLLVVGGVLTLAFHNPVEAVVFGITLSSLALFALLTSLAAAGYSTRREVGRVAYQFLYFAALFGWQFTTNDVFGFHQQVGHAFVVPILIFAAATCVGLLKDSAWAWMIAFGVATAAFLAIQVFGLFFGRKPMDLDHALAYLNDEQNAGQFHSVAAWGLYAAGQRHLRAAGREIQPWIGLTKGMQSYLQGKLVEGDFNTLYALDMMNVGALRPEDVPALKSEYKWEHMFDPNKSHALRSDDVQVRMRLLAEPVSAMDKLSLAEKISKELSPENTNLSMRNFMVGVRTLEILGFEERTQALQPLAHKFLRSTWQTTRDGSQANFVSYASSVQRDEEGRMDASRLTFVHIEPTGLALEAIARWGIPERIDLKALHAYLQESAKGYPSKTLSGYHMLAECARIHLETLPEYRAQLEAPSQESPWDWFLRHRLLMASLLLAIGGVWSTWRAPRSRELESSLKA